ncbi:MAG: hypothetical protein OXR73_07230 [Myxococcales bacterium]|nr:hypothetical protein [Myxococcales bacterium]
MKSRFAGAALLLWGVASLQTSASGCAAGGRYVVVGTAKAPSTSGIIEVDELDGGSRLVTIHMEHLHPPERLSESYDHYVVWFEDPRGGHPIRAGELAYNPDNRTGDLSETSPLSEFTIKITAEKDRVGSTPSAYLVATQPVRAD